LGPHKQVKGQTHFDLVHVADCVVELDGSALFRAGATGLTRAIEKLRR
jgi:hypothetical protein